MTMRLLGRRASTETRTRLTSRADEIYTNILRELRERTDRMFLVLLLTQWVFAVGLAIWVSPYAWAGTTRAVSLHVRVAIVMGAAINMLPIALILTRPGWWGTRQVVAVTQMLWSAVLIHLTGGRIETHFHVFGSLAFLAVYRDWRVLATATVVIAVDHLVRGLWWPESVYGLANPEWWRFLEHALWVVFENTVLVISGARGLAMARGLAEREAALEQTNTAIEAEVADRTAELKTAMELHRRQHDRELELERELRQAQKLESLGRLAAGVAHEINTPIQFVSDSISFARDATGDLIAEVERHGGTATSPDLAYVAAEVPVALDRALDGLGRVAAIVKSMKHVAYPERHEMTAIDLNAALRSTLTIARSEYRYVADLETDLGELPPVTCHPGDISQALLNLVVNAAHAIGEKVRDTGATGRITVRSRRDGDAAVITITDDGGGIPDHVRDRMFEPFFTTKEVGRGTGLGLSLVYGIVTDSGGAIEVASTPGRGSRFAIYLPRVEPPELATDAAAGPIQRGRGERVLVVDDEEALVAVTSEVLKHIGYEPLGCSDGAAALAAFETGHIDAVIADEVMPELTGTELARALRRHRADLPIILMSGYSGPMLAERALAAGITEVLKKPVQSREIASALARALGHG